MSYATSSDQSQMAAQQPSMTDSSAIPDLVRIGQIPTNTAIDIETDILDPVVHSDTFCRFQFQNKGILHSNSKIVLRLKSSGVSGYLPVGVGIHSLIERCALRVGTKTISEIDDFNHYIGYKSMFLSNEHQKQRELFISGRRLAHKPAYSESVGATDWKGTDNQLQTEAQRVTLDNGTVADCPRATNGGTGDIDPREFVKITNTYGPEFAVSIQDLFPFLYQNQLPLFMMKEPVTIELFFSKAIGDRICLAQGSGDAGQEFLIDQTATELVADYQYFPQEMMEAYAAQNANLSFTFMDYRLAKRTITQTATGTESSSGELILNVGGAGRLVTKVISMVSEDSVTTDSMLGNYHARGMMRQYTGTEADRFNGRLTSNIKYNDHFLYPVDVDNSAQQFHNLVSAEGMVPFIYREEYNFEGQGLANGTYAGHSLKDHDRGLAANFFYQAYGLNRNERINSRGIELYQTYNKLENKSASPASFTQRNYLELIRVATLENGIMSVAFA